jgi:cell division protein FtsL
MTATQESTGRVATADDAARAGRSPSRSAERAYRRREKRERRLNQDRLSRTGRPVRSALARVPFVVALIAVLGGGISGVLYLNTKTDESGIRTEQAQQDIAEENLQIEALNRSIADLDATPRLAQQAKELGMVPAGDAAILQVPASGAPTLIGTPSVVPTPPPAKSTAGAGSASTGSTTPTTKATKATTAAKATGVAKATGSTATGRPPATGAAKTTSTPASGGHR